MKSNKGWSFGYLVLILILLACGYYLFFLTDAQKDALDLKLGFVPSGMESVSNATAALTTEPQLWATEQESAVCYDFSGGFFNCEAAKQYLSSKQIFAPVDFYLVDRNQYTKAWQSAGGNPGGTQGSFCFSYGRNNRYYIYCDSDSTLLAEPYWFSNSVVAHELLRIVLVNERGGKNVRDEGHMHEIICGRIFCEEHPGSCPDGDFLNRSTGFCNGKGGLDAELAAQYNFLNR